MEKAGPNRPELDIWQRYRGHLSAVEQLTLTGISRQSVLIVEHQLATPASTNAPTSLLSLSTAISSFQANSTSHLANYSERAAGFLGLQILHSFY